jgi:hypothetical protein
MMPKTASAPRLIVLLKAFNPNVGGYSHKSGYYLHNGHWHKVEHGKPVPKHAPLAAHPMSGAALPGYVATLDSGEWDKLKIHESNVNASGYNKKLEFLKQMGEKGDTTAILGSGFGTNTYGKKLVHVANHLLAKMGSTHKVSAGQKPGWHAAVEHAHDDIHDEPVVAPPAPAPITPAQVDAPTSVAGDLEALTPAQLDTIKNQKPPKAKPAASSIEDGVPALVTAMHDTSKLGPQVKAAMLFIAKHDGAQAAYTKVLDVMYSTADAEAYNVVHASAIEKYPDIPQPGKDYDPPDFHNYGHVEAGPKEGDVKDNLIFHNGHWRVKVKPHQLLHTFTNKDDGLEAYVHKNSGKPNADGDYAVSMMDTDSGEDVGIVHYFHSEEDAIDSAKAAAMVGDAPDNEDGPELDEGAEIDPKLKSLMEDYAAHQQADVLHMIIGKNAHNPHVQAYAQRMLDKIAASAPLSNAWDGMEAGTKEFLDGYAAKGEWATLHGFADAVTTTEPGHQVKAYAKHLIEQSKKEFLEAPAPAAKPAPAIPAWDGITTNQKKYLNNLATEKNFSKLQALAEADISIGPMTAKIAAYAKHVMEKNGFTFVKDLGPAVAQTLYAKLNFVPWDKFVLPATNTNAKSVNPKLAKLKAAAYAGDKAALEAMKFGVNTYGKKLQLLKETAIAAMAESPPAEPTIAPAAPAEPAEPKELSVEGMDKLEADLSLAADMHDAQNIALHYVGEHGAIPGAWNDAIDSLKAGGHAEAAKSVEKLHELFKKHTAEKAAEDDKLLADLAKPARGDGQVEGASLADLKKKLSTSSYNFAYEHAMDYVIANKKTDAAWTAAIQALSVVGFSSVADGLQSEYYQWSAKNKSDGPHDGDTKQGAYGTLVFSDGHWHAQEEAHVMDTIPLPDVSKLKNPGAVQTMLAYLKDAAKTDPSVLKGATKKMASGKLISTLKGPTTTYKISGQDGSPHGAIYHYIEALKAASKGKYKAAPGAKSVAPKIDLESAVSHAVAPTSVPEADPKSMDSWKQVGPQGGSNPGGKFVDPDGVAWYCKFPADEDMAKSEVLAAKLYKAAGVKGQDAKLITKDGKVGIASRWEDVEKVSPAALAKTDGAQSGFAVDAWLGNWDAVGMGYDNLQVGKDGKAMRVDAGGSLEYRAQGAKKPFGNEVTEIKSMMDLKAAPQAAHIFGSMTAADLTASVAKIAAIPDSKIIDIVKKYGPGDSAAREKLAETLLARKADLLKQFPKAAKAAKKRLNPESLPIDPKRLPKEHDYANWNGPGQGLSSKAYVNAANQALENEMIGIAKAGNLKHLAGMTFHSLNKETGQATGSSHPISEHPSKYVTQLHADLMQLLDEVANPPEPLKLFRATNADSVEAIAAAFPSIKFGTTVNNVKSNEKFGFWVGMGRLSSISKLVPKTVSHFSKQAVKDAHEKFHQMPPLARHFVKSIQSSGSYNTLFREGKEKDHDGNKLSDVAKAALDAATSQPAGTTLYRWQNMTDGMIDAVMKSPEGTVFQATGPMCTSYDPVATQGFGKHQMIIRYAEGAKAVESFGSGGYSSEKEVTTLPNARFVVLSRKFVNNKLTLEVLMLPPDLGINKNIV